MFTPYDATMEEVRPGDLWKIGTHVAYVIAIVEEHADEVLARALFLEGSHVGKSPRPLWITPGEWTLLSRGT